MKCPCEVYGVCPYDAQDSADCALWCGEYDDSYSNEYEYEEDE